MVIVCGLMACADSESAYQPPKSEFTGHFFTRSLSLKMLLSDEFTVQGLNHNERRTYAVEFDKPTRFNVITEKLTGDTVWVGRASRGNELWLLQTMVTDTTYWVSGLAVDGNMLLGFLQEDLQMKEIDSLVTKGVLESMVIDNNPERPIIEVDRIAIQPHLERVLAKIPVEYQLTRVGAAPAAKGTDIHRGGYFERASYSAERGLAVSFKQAGNYLLEITSNKGFVQVVQVSGVTEIEQRLKEFKGDFLKLTLTDADTESVLDNYKVSVE